MDSELEGVKIQLVRVCDLRSAVLAAALLLFCRTDAHAVSPYDQSMREASVCASRREPAKAINAYTRAIAAKPNDSTAYAKRAFQFCWLKKFDQAKADYDKAIAISPRDPSLYRDRGCLLGRTHKFEEAIKDFSKSIELNPKVSAPYLDRARAYQALNQPEKARNDMDMALKFYSQNSKVGMRGNSVYFMYGDNARPTESQKKLGHVGKALFVALRGNLSGAAGDFDEALHDMDASRKMLQRRPNRNSVSKSFKEKGKIEKLINGYSRLIYLNPRDIDSFYNRAIVYVSLEQWNSANSNFARVGELANGQGKVAAQASVWHYIGLKKLQDKRAEQTLKTAVERCQDKSWPYPLLLYLNKQKSKQDILQLAHSNEQMTQARCVIGFAESIAGHEQESLKQFEWIENQGDLTLDEYVIAMIQLADSK